MRDSLKAEDPYIGRDPEWRAAATEVWQRIGGSPEEYEKIFAESDRRSRDPIG